MITANGHDVEAEGRALDMPERMLDEKQLLELLGFSRSTLYRLIKQGAFPRGLYVSANTRRWLASEVARWQRELAEADAYDPGRRRGHGRGRRVSATS
ncbi:putative DNA-binding transcriptional regulator AlpA [Bradyrhizobium sp. LM2.7]